MKCALVASDAESSRITAESDPAAPVPEVLVSPDPTSLRLHAHGEGRGGVGET